MQTNNRPRRSTRNFGRNRRTFSSHTSSRGSFRAGQSTQRSGTRRYLGRYNGPHRARGGAKKPNAFDPSKFINTNPVEQVEEMYTPTHTFNTFGLNQRIVKAVSELNIDTPTPIQDQVIPEIMSGRDVIGLAETGTGKTAAFLIPLIESVLKNPKQEILILTPTRELAIQIREELRKLSNGMRIFSTTCVGGANIRAQIQSLRRPNHFIIGTPGRVMDLIKRKSLRPEFLNAVVLDEADRMLDMGFINDMRSILSAIPKERQTLFFSATMSKETEKLVNDFLIEPITVSVKKKDVTNSIAQDVVRYRRNNKFETLLELLIKPEYKRVIIFGAMKHSVEKLAKELSASGIKAESIHGNKTHTARQRALAQFKNGASPVLVATDVAARGIHVDDITHVINYDLPNTFEDYVHRIGRTGRGAKKGKALTFVQGTPTSSSL